MRTNRELGTLHELCQVSAPGHERTLKHLQPMPALLLKANVGERIEMSVKCQQESSGHNPKPLGEQKSGGPNASG